MDTIRCEVADGIASVTLARPEVRNAQNLQMTKELDATFAEAGRRDDVKVIVLQADGPHFSSGHDLRDPAMREIGSDGQEAHYAWEDEWYFQTCWRWRNLPKPLIAAAQGKTIAGGLMLLWVADIIVAADDAMFSDPVVAMGVNGLWVSNHGGRQLDGVLSSARALPPIADAVKGQIKILVDSGIRNGLDVVRTIALGADAAMIGRAYIYALAAAGEAGVSHLLELLAVPRWSTAY